MIAGNEAFLSELGVEISAQAKEQIAKAQNEGNGVVLAAVDKIYVGFIALSDRVKDDAAQAIQSLKNAGVTTVMLTGDNAFTAKNVAGKLGIEKVFAGMLPNEKFETIKRLQEEGAVLFVGDGINDAAPLKQANVGIAMSSGADIVKEAGDVVLVKNDLKSAVSTINLANETMKTIRQNLFWAFVYNAVCIPVAAGVLAPLGLMLTPVYGAAAMCFSSVTVVLNSIRLRFKQI